jgi:hypothetical protein
VLDPTYRAGNLRRIALLDQLEALEARSGAPYSVALGELGPPELSKLLWEAHLLKLAYQTISTVLKETPETIANALMHTLEVDPRLCQTITSVGIPILLPNGYTLLRGPKLNIPEDNLANEVIIRVADVDIWANKGWVDLRPENFQLWQDRFARIQREANRRQSRGSASLSRALYSAGDNIEIGALVAWIFNNEPDPQRNDAEGKPRLGSDTASSKTHFVANRDLCIPPRD